MPVKSKVEISQNFVAFSEYMNFSSKMLLHKYYIIVITSVIFCSECMRDNARIFEQYFFSLVSADYLCHFLVNFDSFIFYREILDQKSKVNTRKLAYFFRFYQLWCINGKYLNNYTFHMYFVTIIIIILMSTFYLLFFILIFYFRSNKEGSKCYILFFPVKIHS